MDPNSKFYILYNTIIQKSNIISEDNTVAGVGIGPQGDYAPGDARAPKALFKGKIFRRPNIKGVKKLKRR